MSLVARQDWPRLVRWMGFTLLGLVPLLLGRPLHAQDKSPALSFSKTFHQAGVIVDVSAPKGPLSDEEVLWALEEAARQARLRLAERRQAGAAPAGTPKWVSTPAPSFPQTPAPMPPPSEEGVEEGDPSAWRRFVGTIFPGTLLFQPPLANPLQPRGYLKATTLDTYYIKDTIDTAIGGEFGLFRYTRADDATIAVQQDIFAVVFTRFDYDDHQAVDYRFGFPLTFSYGAWQGKLAYEHTSTHLGDIFIERTGRRRRGVSREEVVAGLSYRFWDELRLYGIYGYAFAGSVATESHPHRFDWGLEWSRQRCTGWWGQPFAAFDMELRQDQNYTANVTVQVGWQWLQLDRRPSCRFAFEYYDGKSMYGQFFTETESWYGVGFFVDF